MLYQLAYGHDPAVARALAEAQQKLQTNQAQLGGAAETLRQLRAKLVEIEAAPPNQPAPPVPEPDRAAPEASTPEVTDLRARIRALREELKTRHAERNTLRRALRDTKARFEREDTETAEPAPEPEDTSPAPDASEARLRLPAFTTAFESSLAQVPPGTARAAVEKLCAIAIGRPGAFTDVRRLRGRDWLWRARVGRSYRLLFTLDADRIEAVDLVHRQDLEKRIKQLG